MRLGAFKTVLFIVLFFYLPFQALAWGMLGHRVVGEIADSYLTPKARLEIKKILGNESIAMASNWMDFIKSDTSFKYLDTWHYINFDSNLNYNEMKAYLKTDTTVDAYTKLNFIIGQLKNKKLQQAKKGFYLRLLIHIVGDIHQPLHVSAKGTTGGNDIRLQWFSEPTNLHRVWDTHLPEFQQLSYTEFTKTINFTNTSQRKLWQGQPISQWLFESYSLAQKIHDEIRQPNQRLSYHYNFNHVQTMNEQMLKGGVRLAGLLNQIFGS